MSRKSKPGPRAVSCETCRQRRKKCDLARPFCERCIKGSYTCLGYGDDVKQTHAFEVLGNLELQPIVPAPSDMAWEIYQPVLGSPIRSQLGVAEPPEIPTPGLHKSYPPLGLSSLGGDVDLQAFANGRLDLLQRAAVVENNPPTPSDCDLGSCFNHLQLQDQSFCKGQYQNPTYLFSQTTHVVGLRPDPRRLDTILNSIYCSIPRSINTAAQEREGLITLTLTEYALRRVRKFFYQPPMQLRESLIHRLRQSTATLCVMHIGARLFRMLSDNPSDRAIKPYILWIDEYNRRVAKITHCNLVIEQLEDTLLAQLELAFLKFIVGGIRAGYTVLRNSLPSFLRLVSLNPKLCMEYRGSLLISFSDALATQWFEIPRFVIYDLTTSLILGLAPIAQYGFDGGQLMKSQTSLDWVHGVPAELLSALAQVNAWRSGASETIEDWRVLEARVLGWQPQVIPCEEGESQADGVARLAVQESWRHTVLVYIYMGMCHVSSHDPRVQSSVQQIAKLVQVPSGSHIEAHLFIHCVVAGVAAKYERHRVIIRNILLSLNDASIWLSRGPEFSRVLEHLWNGPGKDGYPVVWDDYVHSRRATIDI